ncbi:MAG: hypothetical protein FJY67_01185 [Calditrichaeota bacterium]|nr:hypothetical protein [Calditrichota bacterium]
MPIKYTLRIALFTALILLVPLTAMQFTDEVDWSLSDFVIAGVLLFGAGLVYKVVTNRGGTTAYRVAAGVAIFAALMLFWVNGAVGLIGSENNPANLMYLGVIGIGIIGGGIVRFKPGGMARVMFAVALAQALIPLFALIIWKYQAIPERLFWGALGGTGVFTFNSIFVMLFAVSAFLFRHAGSLKKLSSS